MADLVAFNNGEDGLDVRTLINNIVDKINTELVESLSFNGSDLTVNYVDNSTVVIPIIGEAGNSIWGGIEGTIENQTDLIALVETKSPLQEIRAGANVTFDKSATYVSDTNDLAPLTESTINIDGLLADALPHAAALIIHQSSVEPSIDYGEFTLVKTVGRYVETTPETINYILITHIGVGQVMVTYIDEAAIPVATQIGFDSELYTSTNVADALDEVITAIPTVGTAAAEDVGYFATAAQGGTADSAVQPTDTQTGGMSMFIETVANQDYIFAIKMPFAGTITETTTKCTSGTATATFKINTTALGGTANAISSAEQSQAQASSNTFAAGDDIICTVSANSTCLKASLNIKFTYNLAS